VLFAFDNAPSALIADWSTEKGRVYALSSDANEEQVCILYVFFRFGIIMFYVSNFEFIF
jgi:hypothetical protein